MLENGTEREKIIEAALATLPPGDPELEADMDLVAAYHHACYLQRNNQAPFGGCGPSHNQYQEAKKRLEASWANDPELN